MDSSKEFDKLMAMLFVVYDQYADTTKCDAYWHFLKKYTIEQISWAINEYVKNDKRCEFFPRPGQLIRLINDLDEMNVDNDAHVKWEQVYENVKRGIYEHDDLNVNRAINQIGGWGSLRLMLENEEFYKRRDFVERYTAINNKSNHEESYNKFINSSIKKLLTQDAV